MKVCTAQQMAAIDRDTIAAGTSGIELMERAGRALCDALDAGGRELARLGDPDLVVYPRSALKPLQAAALDLERLAQVPD